MKAKLPYLKQLGVGAVWFTPVLFNGQMLSAALRAALTASLFNILDGAGASYRERLLAAVRRPAKRNATVVLRSFGEPPSDLKTKAASRPPQQPTIRLTEIDFSVLSL